MRFFTVILLINVVTKLFSQNDFKDTTWFDVDWKESIKSKASYFRVYKTTTKGFLVFDKFLNGQVQMIAEASAIKPEVISEGTVVYYNENGTISSKGNCVNDKKIGRWVVYKNEGKDSTLMDYQANGDIKYLKKGTTDQYEAETFTVVEEMPEFPGGIQGMMNFIRTTIIYPTQCRKQGLGGKIFLKFIVSTEGKVTDAQVLKSSGFKLLDAEALRVVNLMPIWKPGFQNRKAVNVYFNLPINFSLDGGEPFYVFNVNNNNPNYIKSLDVLTSENIKHSNIIDLLSESLKSNNTDELYNLGVAYYFNKDKKRACECFKKIVSLSNDNLTTVVNSNKFILKSCN
jgi:periplasmic protein TonB